MHSFKTSSRLGRVKIPRVGPLSIGPLSIGRLSIGRLSVSAQLAATVLVAIALLPGCQSAPAPASASVPATDSSSVAATESPSLAHPALWPEQHSPIARDDALEARVQALLKTMTVEEKVGQIVQGDLGSVTPDDVRKYRLGSVLAGGNSDPGGKYNSTGPEWLALADKFYAASMDTSGGGKAIPVLLGIDAVHGHNNVVGATLFPHNIALGATNDPALIKRIAQATATELRSTGFEWTFAPTVTVPRDDRWGRTYEGYSENPELVSRYATEVVEGLQGTVGQPGFLDATHVLASSKHFIGDGGTFEGKDTGDTRVSEAELRDIHGAGHMAALRAGTQTVMASFSSWNGEKIHGKKSLLTGVLKERLGFDGFIVGDWNAHGRLPGCSNDGCAAAINAGLDMFMAPDSWRAVFTNTVAQVKSGEIPMARLDDAVTRILRVKMRLGLFEAGAPSKRPLGGHFEQLGSPAHRALAREAVRESLVLLKNEGQLLPLNPHARVLVAGDGADDVGKQAGGWTLSWQGTGNQPGDFAGATSIWAGIRAATKAAGGKAELAVDGAWHAKPDVAIVVFGENPYAEFLGDIANLDFQPGKERDLALLRKLKVQGIPVVSVFLSGRPLWVNREINASDAFVAAWLPGSEGAGLADVLFKTADGKIGYDFRGRLPYSWPATATQGPLNVGQADYHPQFAFAYGLGYAAPASVGVLPEVSGLRHDGSVPGLYFAAGALAPGATWMLADGDGTGHELTSLPSGALVQGLRVSATDHLAQEDARRLQWRGGQPAWAWLQLDAAQDLSRESSAGTSLVVTLKLDAAPEGGVELSLGCGPACTGQVALDKTLRGLPLRKWVRVGVPLGCFAKAGADMTRIDRVFGLFTLTALDFSVSRVALENDSDYQVECSKP
ncbi:exo 1,3/1,4-beta-D-glucan glucohydrolase [soil metagenome]